MRYFNFQYGTSTPCVYMNGVGRSRAAIGDRLGSEALNNLEQEAFAKTLRGHPQRDELLTTVEDLEVAPVASKYPGHGLGPVGAVELIAKLGIFLALMREDEIFTRRK